MKESTAMLIFAHLDALAAMRSTIDSPEKFEAFVPKLRATIACINELLKGKFDEKVTFICG